MRRGSPLHRPLRESMPTYEFLFLSLQRGLHWQFKREHRPVRLIVTRLDLSVMIRRTMASPSPVPLFFRVKYGTKSLSWSSGAMPGPSSATLTIACRRFVSYLVVSHTRPL